MAEACALIHQRGYTAVGVADICAAAGVPKGSFYYFFGSKQALTIAVIEEHWVTQRAQWTSLLTSRQPPLLRLRALFDATMAAQVESLRAATAVTGCLFANLALELSAQDATVRERLASVFDEQIALVGEVISEAAAAGDIADLSDVPGAARSVVAQLEGLVIFAKLANDPAVLGGLWRQSLLLLGAKQEVSAV